MRRKKRAAMIGFPLSIIYISCVSYIITIYIRSVQPSRVITVNIVSIPDAILSKLVMPKFMYDAIVRFSFSSVKPKSCGAPQYSPAGQVNQPPSPGLEHNLPCEGSTGQLPY